MKSIQLVCSLILLFLSSLAFAQFNFLKNITEYSSNAVLLHAIEFDGHLLSIVPMSKPTENKSGFILYKANSNLKIVDSLNRFYNQSQTFISNMTMGINGKTNVAISIGDKPVGLKIYTINNELFITDSVQIIDSNFQINRFVFGNLIDGPNGDFVLNCVFYKEEIPYNVYYLFDGSLKLKKKYVDSNFVGVKNYNKIVSGNMLFLNEEYVTLQSSPPLEIYSFNAIKRFSKNLDLIYAGKVTDQLYNERVFNSPININNKWIISNMFTHWQGSNSFYSANLISIDSENRITPKTLFKPEYGKVDGNASISNYGALYDKQTQTIEVIFNSGGSYLSSYAIRLVFDTSYQLINNTMYEYPVNKLDTIYSFIHTNGCINFNGKLLIYGYLYKSEKGKRIPIEIPRPFIEPIENLDLVLGNKNIQEEEKSITIYPNPFSSELIIQSKESNLKVIILDNTGRTVFLQTIESIQTLNFEHLEAGIYYLMAKNNNGQVYSQKLIKVD
jgi:hypothetical protein